MAANNRLYYAIKQVALRPYSTTLDDPYTVVHGAQDLSISTQFNLSPIFELGQLELLDQIEELPDINVTMSKIFDGRPLIWHLMTSDAVTPTLAGRSVSRADLALGLFPDTNNSATGTPTAVVSCPGLYPQSFSYTLGVDGAFTENVTLVGNEKICTADNKILASADITRRNALRTEMADSNGVFAGQFDGNDIPSGIENKAGLLWSYDGSLGVDSNSMVADPDATILPPEVDGISTSGTNDLTPGGQYKTHVQSITVSTDLGRESLDELGRRLPYFRYATFPVEVTCAIEAYSLSGDNISATEGGTQSTGGSCSNATNLKNRTIRIATCGGARFYLGTKNRLSSVEFGGGGAQGGNDTNSYNFTNFNSFTVMAEYDPAIRNTGGTGADSEWWTNRADYLVDA